MFRGWRKREKESEEKQTEKRNKESNEYNPATSLPSPLQRHRRIDLKPFIRTYERY